MRLTTVPISAAILLTTLGHATYAEPPRLRVEHKNELLCLAWSPDGKLVYTCTYDGLVRIIDPSIGKELRSFSTGSAGEALAVSPDGTTLAVHHPPPTMAVDTWNIASGKKSQSFYTSHHVKKLGFSGSGKELVILGPGLFWRSGLDGLSPSIERFPGHESGSVAIATDGSASGWCIPGGQLHVRIHGQSDSPAVFVKAGVADCIAFGPGGSLLAVGASGYKGVALWDLPQEKKTTLLVSSSKPAAALDISANGKTLAALSEDGVSIDIWDVARSRLFRHLSTFSRPVSALALSPDGKLLAAVEANGQALLIWATAAGPSAPVGPRVALTQQELTDCWTDLNAPEHDRMSQAWRKFGAAGDSAIAFIRQKIRTVTRPEARRTLDKLIADLDSDKFVIRERAIKELVAFGDLAFFPLQRLVQSPPSLEAATRASLLLKKLGEPKLTPDCFRVFEAIDLLEQLGTADAIGLLKEIEREALVSPIQREAQQALERIMRSAN
jgi:WD40 repeat protein